MKELSKERIAELEREAENVYPLTPNKEQEIGMSFHNLKQTLSQSAWLSCAKEYELKLIALTEELSNENNLSKTFEKQVVDCANQLVEKGSFIEKLKEDITRMYGDIFEKDKEITRREGLIKDQWEIRFYLTCPPSVHEGVMAELFRNQWKKFESENNL